ncbi:restriction endonuclease [Luteimonas fraxinea]|uniref:Restriction endonuclease n=1 Tax=Luteimonas fraxinea TaxID=2901869 RepID=A0ABS8UDD8_9GAMM|nr:restriction endonuclease [Luteimonas fraxinea]MCD9097515.1 restriction endonuclease [Luteimonas fraxinea]UHH11765.1 restriction endonuclease [Luteimonas fraxinea]
MAKKLSFEAKEKMVELAGACFWYWAGFYSFLDSCGVPKTVQRKYPRETYNKYTMMRAVLEDLDQVGNSDLVNAIASGFYRLKGPIDRDQLDEKKAKRLLSEFHQAIGDDPIEAEIKKREHERAKATHAQSIADRRAQGKRLEDLNSEFLNLTTASDVTPQQRGFKLELLFFQLLHLSELEHSKPYRTPGREQIDGHFKYEKFDYLVEVKWTQELTKQPDLSIFDGKIRGKAQSTRGFFVSANGFDDMAVQKYSGDSPRIILMTGEDLALVLSGRVLFADAMRAKLDSIVRLGTILFPVRKIAT